MSTRSRSGLAYGLRFGAAAVLYTVLTLTMLPLARSLPEGSLQRYAVATLPVLGVLVGVWALWKFVREADELQSRRLLEALAFSVACTVVVSIAVGFVQSVGGPALQWTWVTPLWAVCFGLGMAWTGWRYR